FVESQGLDVIAHPGQVAVIKWIKPVHQEYIDVIAARHWDRATVRYYVTLGRIERVQISQATGRYGQQRGDQQKAVQSIASAVLHGRPSPGAGTAACPWPRLLSRHFPAKRQTPKLCCLRHPR